jgi:hypothetical protein
MGVAAMAFGVVNLSTIRWDATRQIVAYRTMPGVQGGNRLADSSAAASASYQLAQTNAPGAGSPSAPGGVKGAPLLPPALHSTQGAGLPGRPPSPSVLVFNAEPSKPSQIGASAPLAVPRNRVLEPAQAIPAAAVVTMISEAALLVPPSENRPVVLPISFGKPEAPEDDMAPSTLRWRFHGMARGRHSSYFLPAPGATSTSDSVAEICRRAGFLH